LKIYQIFQIWHIYIPVGNTVADKLLSASCLQCMNGLLNTNPKN